MKRLFPESQAESQSELERRVTDMESVIAEQGAREQMLSQSVARFQELYDEAPVGYHELNAEGRITSVNRTELNMLGYTLEEMLGHYVWEFTDNQEAARQAVAAKIAGSQPVHSFERVLRRKDGTSFPALIEDRLLRDARGNINGIRSTIQDISERKRIEKALRESEERHRTLIKSLPQRVFFKDCRSAFISVNDSFAGDLGMRPEDLIGKTDHDLFPKESADKYRAFDLRVIETRQSETLEEVKVVEGHERIVEVVKAPVIGDDGDVLGVLGLYTDITDRKQAEAALKESQGWLAAIFEASRDGIVVEENDIIVYANKSFAHLYGYDKAEELIGKPTSIVQAPSDNERMVEFGRKCSRGESTPSVYEFKGIQKDETVIDAEASVSAFSIGDKSYIITSVRNIVERKRIMAELEETRDLALESVRLKSEFLANMSHEIRTPMNGVIGMTGLLLDTDLSDDQRDFAETIQSSADALLTIIDDILDFSKIEAGQLRFEKIDFDLRVAVEAPVELLAERAQAKALEFASLVYKDVPTLLRGDPGRLRQVLTNLLGNAVKFTERGEVVVCVSKERETEHHVTLRFEITDTGIGISEESQRRLFRPFTQADGSTTRKYGGTGLGLAISKQLVELMGGEIGIESAPNVGSTFWFTGAFEKQPEQAVKEALPAGAVSLEGARVLIVDDNATNRKIFLHQTTSWGMIAAEAESGMQAIEMLRHAAAQDEPYDIAILDLMMPNMDGFQLANAIKSDQAIAGVRLVLLPSFGKRGHGEAARQTGIAAYLQKPVRQSQLYNCLTVVMSQPIDGEVVSSTRLVTRHTLREVEATPNVSAATSGVRILLAEDNAVNQKVALSQLQRLGYRADAVPNGREAIKALEKNHYDIILMDCQMPEMDGYEATEEIRRSEGTAKRTTIIAMTANALESDRQRCLTVGMDDYISKPVKTEVLRQILDRWLEPTNGQAPAAEIEKQKSSLGKPEEEAVDLSVLASYREVEEAGQPGLINELIDLFIYHTREQLVALRGAVTKGDVQGIKTLTHTLKGGSANIGAHLMAKLGEELEAKSGISVDTEVLIARLEAEFERVRGVLEAERGASS